MALWDSLWGAAPDPATGLGGTGLLGSADYIGDIGFGLLANSGPSLQPHSFGSSLGRAGMYASERQGERLKNDAFRQELGIKTREQKGYADLANWAKENPELAADPAAVKAATLQFAPELAAKAMLSGGLSPLEQLLARSQVDAAQTKAQADAFALQQDYTAIRTNARQQHAALKALDTLESVQGGGALLNSPTVFQLATSGIGMNEFTKKVLEVGGTAVYGIPKEDLPRVLSAAYTVEKAIKNISTNSQRAVQGQANQAQGLGVGAPIDVRRQIFTDMYDESTRLLKTNPNWSMPEMPDRYSFEGGEEKPPVAGLTPPAVGSQNGRIVTQPPPVYGDPAAAPPITPSEPLPGVAAPPPAPGVSDWMTSLKGLFSGAPQTPMQPPTVAPAAGGPPPVAAPQPMRLGPAPAAPTPRKVPTVSIDPATGNPMQPYPRKADGERATPKGQKFIAPDPKTGEPMVWQN